MLSVVTVCKLDRVFLLSRLWRDFTIQSCRHYCDMWDLMVIHVYMWIKCSATIYILIRSSLAVIKCLLVASPGFVKVSKAVCTLVYVYGVLLPCRISFMNIYSLRLSRMTIKFWWKINPSFYWYTTLSSLTPLSHLIPCVILHRFTHRLVTSTL